MPTDPVHFDDYLALLSRLYPSVEAMLACDAEGRKIWQRGQSLPDEEQLSSLVDAALAAGDETQIHALEQDRQLELVSLNDADGNLVLLLCLLI